jgi:hypothetical protein
VLILKPMPTRITAEWMAQQLRDGRWTKSKIGSYPAMSLADAREIFKRDFAHVIRKGSGIKVASGARAGTDADLFEAYVQHLRDTDKPSWHDIEAALQRASAVLGPQRRARDIAPDDVLGVLRPIYEAGSLSMADHLRSYIRAAYSWGLKSEHDYRHSSPRRFGLNHNPAAGIPTEPKVPGTRWLDEEEFVRLYRWLESPAVHPRRRILMLTGQRVEQIAHLRANQWDAKERIIDWSRTKNGKPHAIRFRHLQRNSSVRSFQTATAGSFRQRRTHRGRSARPRSTASCGVGATEASFRSLPIATCGGRGRHLPAKLACRRKSATASKTMPCRM